ncbi:Hypp3463 [Branchiostoma lanceolatum]|uniref:Hypp3463 protein n=1 Tax=Branchiostoma lanceolatum TaxID=7740 RepID=A0A8K0A515_BRALA|nr:Hypp3463 [Branchiostoma lanceolatum]
MAPSASRALVHWKPVNNRLLLARLRHTHGKISVIVAYAPTNMAPDEEKDEFFSQISSLMNDISRHDIVWIIGDLNATTGLNRTSFESALGPHGSGTCKNNGLRLLEFCSNFRLRTERSFFQHKLIHSMTWFSNDGHTRKELDHILTSRRWHTSTHCRVYRSAELGNSDHRLLAMTVCLRLQRNSTNKAELLSLITRLARNSLGACGAMGSPSGSHHPRAPFGRASGEVGFRETLSAVEAKRKARLEGNLTEWRRLNDERNKLLCKDKQKWLDNLAEEAETAAHRGDQGSLYRTLNL